MPYDDGLDREATSQNRPAKQTLGAAAEREPRLHRRGGEVKVRASEGSGGGRWPNVVWDGHSPSVLAWTDTAQVQKDHYGFSDLPQFGQSCHTVAPNKPL